MDWENEDDDFLEQAQRRAKRNFLHEEILEAGFSGSLFTAFCEQERSSDIDQWSFEDLQDCVRRFKAKVTEEEFKEKPKTEGREESPKSHVAPAEVKRDPSPPAADTATRPKLVEVQSSPLDRFRANSKDYTKTVYHPPQYEFATAPKDLPKPAIILPHLKIESSKLPAVVPEPLAIPQKESPLQKPVAYSPEIKPLKQPHGMFPLMPPQSSEVVVQKSVKVTETIPLKPAQVTEVIPQKPPPVPEVIPQKSQTHAEVTPQKVRGQSSEAVLLTPISSPEVPILTKPEEKAYERKQVSMSFLLADGPASLLPSADYAIPGHTLPSTELSSHSSSLKVIIENHEIVPGGLLSSSYVAYGVRTEPLGWNVKRRFNDFFWLRGILQIQFPGYYVPPIPKKQNTGRLADDTILKRRRFLTRFMETIVKTPLFLRSQFLVAFLSESAIESMKKTSAKLKRPERLEDFSTLDGSSHCTEALATEFMQQCNEYLSYTEILKKKLKKQSQALMDAIKMVSLQIEAIADTYRSLAEVRDTVTGLPLHGEVFSAYAAALMDWSTCEMRLGEAVYEHFDTFYKFRYQEMTVLKEELKERDIHLATYLKGEERLIARKEKLWAQGDPGKWELDAELDIKAVASSKDLAMFHMLPKETALVTRSKDLFAFFNHQALSEVKRIVTESIEMEKVNALEFALHHNSFLRDLQLNWESLISALSKAS